MPTTQISKIQLRRGLSGDLPGAPTSTAPPSFPPGLDDGEMCFTTDTGRMFIGQHSPTNGQANFQRIDYPYQNVEILTENSPSIRGPITGDNQAGFIQTVPLIETSIATTLQVYDAAHVAQDFYLDFSNGACAMLHYFIFDSTNRPIRLGRLHVLWNAAMAGEPLLAEDGILASGNLSDIQWTATLVGSIAEQHVVLQYTNGTGNSASMHFRIDRPLIG